MPSPFPGMNPYIENDEVWPDFHGRFIAAAADALAAQVDPNYIVRAEAHLYIHEPDSTQRILAGRSDVWVARQHEMGPSGSSTTVISSPAPAHVRLPQVDVERVSYIQIRSRHGRTVVTVLELLSPSNKKTGADREQYLLKRAQLLASQVNYVEIDLLRGGPRMDTDDPLPPCDYYALVCRPQDRPRADLWPARLRERLPVIPIPLREPDPDARLDLQEIVHRIYDAARYASSIYDDQPVPPLDGTHAEWARDIVGARR